MLFTKGKNIHYPSSPTLVRMSMHALVLSLKEEGRTEIQTCQENLPTINRQRMEKWGKVHCKRSQDTKGRNTTVASECLHLQIWLTTVGSRFPLGLELVESSEEHNNSNKSGIKIIIINKPAAWPIVICVLLVSKTCWSYYEEENTHQY